MNSTSHSDSRPLLSNAAIKRSTGAIMITCICPDLGKRGAPSGTRTPNPLIKSQLLCQLS
jgi:hypothetical protein